MTPVEKLPLEGTPEEAFRIYFSRLQTFGQVALYSGCTLALVACPLMARSAQQRLVVVSAVLSTFLLVYGFPRFIRAIRIGPTAPLDAFRIAADVTFTYGLLNEFAFNRASERVAPMQKAALDSVSRFPGEVSIEKTYSTTRNGAHETLLIIQERLMRRDKPITATLTTMIVVKDENLDDIEHLSIMRMISGFGLAFAPDKTTIRRSNSLPEGFSGRA
jgi:hypothetical protein